MNIEPKRYDYHEADGVEGIGWITENNRGVFYFADDPAILEWKRKAEAYDSRSESELVKVQEELIMLLERQWLMEGASQLEYGRMTQLRARIAQLKGEQS